jgi:Spy/CpxP family protein refolding chaperone
MKPNWTHATVAFALGGIVGFAGMWWSAPYFPHRRWGHGQFQAHPMQRFSSQLKLTPEQRTQVAAILEAKRLKIDAFRAEMKPKFEEIRTSTSAEIRQILTPEQQRRFDEMNAEFEARGKRLHEKFRKGPPGEWSRGLPPGSRDDGGGPP